MKSGHARALSADVDQSIDDALIGPSELAIADAPFVRQHRLNRQQGKPEWHKLLQKSALKDRTSLKRAEAKDTLETLRATRCHRRHKNGIPKTKLRLSL